jgi:osmotically-inducible protein OsmY
VTDVAPSDGHPSQSFRQPDAYVVERIREALAHDSRVAELGIAVTVAADEVVLTGDVANESRKAVVTAVVAPLTEGRKLHNRLTVCSWSVTDAEETIP